MDPFIQRWSQVNIQYSSKMENNGTDQTFFNCKTFQNFGSFLPSLPCLEFLYIEVSLSTCHVAFFFRCLTDGSLVSNVLLVIYLLWDHFITILQLLMKLMWNFDQMNPMSLDTPSKPGKCKTIAQDQSPISCQSSHTNPLRSGTSPKRWSSPSMG